MERMAKALLLLLILSMLAGCARIESFSIENPVKVTVQTDLKPVEITDEEIISVLTEGITSKEFRRGERYDRFGWDGSYWIRWYDENDEVIFDALVYPTGMVYREYFWDCENGTIDTEYYDELLKDSE